MRNIKILTMNELKEAIEDMKVLWLPIFFAFIGLTQPLVTKYMDVLLANFTSGDEIIFNPNSPDPRGAEVLSGTLSSQFDQLGLIILVISIMGVILIEKKNGYMNFIFTRPVKPMEYITAKFTGQTILIFFSISLGYSTSYLYTGILFEFVGIQPFLFSLLNYLAWIAFIVSLVILFNVLMNKAFLVALFTIFIAFLLRMGIHYAGTLKWLFPSISALNSVEVLTAGTYSIAGFIITLGWTAGLLFISNRQLLKRR